MNHREKETWLYFADSNLWTQSFEGNFQFFSEAIEWLLRNVIQIRLSLINESIAMERLAVSDGITRKILVAVSNRPARQNHLNSYYSNSKPEYWKWKRSDEIRQTKAPKRLLDAAIGRRWRWLTSVWSAPRGPREARAWRRLTKGMPERSLMNWTPFSKSPSDGFLMSARRCVSVCVCVCVCMWVSVCVCVCVATDPLAPIPLIWRSAKLPSPECC